MPMRNHAVRLIGCLGAICAYLATVAAAEDYTLAAYPPCPASYRRLADTLQAHLFDEVLARWYPACIDKQHGGFRCHFRQDWTPGDRNDKTLVFQARMTWVAAEVARRYPDKAAEYTAYARHGLAFLDDVLWDRQCGGLFWGVDEQGHNSPRYGMEKHAYGISFALYAASAVARTTGDRRALDLAQRTFLWLDQHAHDAVNGGYYEALRRDGKPVLDAGQAEARAGLAASDLLGTHYGYKSMNSHIHLLEAVTALYEVWHDPRVEARLKELLTIVRDRIAVPPGCLNLYFTPDWRPLPEHDSFGHDIETAFLLLEAQEALGASAAAEAARTSAVARSLVDHALDVGWDRQHGGFYDRGPVFGAACGTEKVWWTQAEGLNALLLMHQHYGAQTPRYYEAFLRQWSFIVNHQFDQKQGEWFATVGAAGHPVPGDKGHPWKAAYHNGRALMNTSSLLRTLP